MDTSQRRFWVILGLAVLIIAAVLGSLALSTEEEADDPTTTADNNQAVLGDAETADAIEDTPLALGIITPQQYQESLASEPHLLLDVRTPEEFAEGYIEGAQNIPLQVLAENLDELPRDIPIVLYCRSGNRSAQAAELLAGEGFTQIYDVGGIQQWQAAGFTLVQ